MAWFDRAPGEKKNPSEVSSPPPLSPAKSAEEVPAESAAEELVAYLYKGSRVTGQLTFHGPARIDGSDSTSAPTPPPWYGVAKSAPFAVLVREASG